MSTSNYRNMGPYGMKFGEEELFRQREINQYRKDLDFLTSLRRPYGDMTQKEWEEYQRKINYMNDRYAYGEMDRKNFLKGMVKGYEDESIRRKQEDVADAIKFSQENYYLLIDIFIRKTEYN